MSKSIYEFGIEQENLVVDKDGSVYLKDINLENYYTKDFASNQVELVTPVFQDKKTFKDFYDEVLKRVKKRYFLWPISAFEEFNQNDVEAAVFDDPNEIAYRRYLQKKYPINKLLYCGVHYCFSFTADYLASEAKRQNVKNDAKFRNNVYFKILKNFYHYGPMLLFFTSYSPEGDNIISERNSTLGFSNELKTKLNFENLESYYKSIQDAVDKKVLYSAKELFSKIRLKSSMSVSSCNMDVVRDIKYIEFRALDLNPLSKNGFDVKNIDFLNAFFHFLYLQDEKSIDYKEAIKNFDEVCLKGYMGAFKFGKKIYNAQEFVSNVFKEMHATLNRYDQNYHEDVLDKFYTDFITKKLPCEQIRRRTKGLSKTTYGLKVMRAKSEK